MKAKRFIIFPKKDIFLDNKEVEFVESHDGLETNGIKKCGSFKWTSWSYIVKAVEST